MWSCQLSDQGHFADESTAYRVEQVNVEALEGNLNQPVFIESLDRGRLWWWTATGLCHQVLNELFNKNGQNILHLLVPAKFCQYRVGTLVFIVDCVTDFDCIWGWLLLLLLLELILWVFSLLGQSRAEDYHSWVSQHVVLEHASECDQTELEGRLWSVWELWSHFDQGKDLLDDLEINVLPRLLSRLFLTLLLFFDDVHDATLIIWTWWVGRYVFLKPAWGAW